MRSVCHCFERGNFSWWEGGYRGLCPLFAFITYCWHCYLNFIWLRVTKICGTLSSWPWFAGFQREQGNPPSVGDEFINAPCVSIGWSRGRVVGVHLCFSFRIFG